MIKKIAVLVAAAACTGFVVICIPGFAREIAASVLPFSKIHLGTEDGGLAVRPPDVTCRHDPWPYGCDWRTPIERKQIAKKVRNRHYRYALITAR